MYYVSPALRSVTAIIDHLKNGVRVCVRVCGCVCDMCDVCVRGCACVWLFFTCVCASAGAGRACIHEYIWFVCTGVVCVLLYI